MPMISLLVSDVDGTLITSQKALTPRTIEAVRGLAKRGIAFAVTSGRPPRGMAMLNMEVTHQATIIAYIDDFKLMLVLAIIVVPLLLLVRTARTR